MLSFSIDQWCAAHGFSRSFFYKMQKQGNGPRVFKVGASTRISAAAAAEWLAEREAASTVAA
jgi:predicted DNA-binding transcriptional regulator AlpA